jgi:hypothetical protein
MIHHPLHNQISRELDPGEKIKWAGQPDPKASAITAAKLCLPTAAFMIFLTWLAFSSVLSNWSQFGGFSSTNLLVLGFVVFGMGFSLFLALLPLWTRSVAKNTIYVITQRRLMTVRQLGSQKQVKSIPARNIINIEYTQHASNFGDLLVESNSQPRITKLRGIAQVQEAERVLRSILA